MAKSSVKTGGTGRSSAWGGNVTKPRYIVPLESMRPSSKLVHMTDAQRARQDMQVKWLQEAIAAQERALEIK
jgi:hypothetical protein